MFRGSQRKTPEATLTFPDKNWSAAIYGLASKCLLVGNPYLIGLARPRLRMTRPLLVLDLSANRLFPVIGIEKPELYTCIPAVVDRPLFS
jgi:hypothetical protein